MTNLFSLDMFSGLILVYFLVMKDLGCFQCFLRLVLSDGKLNEGVMDKEYEKLNVVVIT